MSSGADADRLDADPDPICHFEACPDPATYYYLYPQGKRIHELGCIFFLSCLIFPDNAPGPQDFYPDPV